MKDLYINNYSLKKLPRLFEETFHIESTLYQYHTEQNNKEIILKIFDDYIYKKLMKDKEHKVTYFKNKQYPYLTSPLFAVYIDEYFAGYGMYRFNGINLEEFIKTLSLEEQIELFKLLSDIIKKAHNDNLVFGDVGFNNILTNGKDIKFCDVDSFGTPYSIPTTIPYVLGNNVNLTEKNIGNVYSDLFVINLMVLHIFMGINMNDISKIPIEQFKERIKSLKLSSTLYKVFLNLYKNLLNKEQLVYPRSYLDELYEGTNVKLNK